MTITNDFHAVLMTLLYVRPSYISFSLKLSENIQLSVLHRSNIDGIMHTAGITLEGDESDVIALDQPTLLFSPRKATRMSP